MGEPLGVRGKLLKRQGRRSGFGWTPRKNLPAFRDQVEPTHGVGKRFSKGYMANSRKSANADHIGR